MAIIDNNILTASEAAEIWGLNPNYVRNSINQSPHKWSDGSFKKSGRTIIVTADAMERVTGIPDPRKKRTHDKEQTLTLINPSKLIKVNFLVDFEDGYWHQEDWVGEGIAAVMKLATGKNENFSIRHRNYKRINVSHNGMGFVSRFTVDGDVYNDTRITGSVTVTQAQYFQFVVDIRKTLERPKQTQTNYRICFGSRLEETFNFTDSELPHVEIKAVHNSVAIKRIIELKIGDSVSTKVFLDKSGTISLGGVREVAGIDVEDGTVLVKSPHKLGKPERFLFDSIH